MAIQYADIIFFAIVAVYLGLKLYTVLGKRDKDDDIISRINAASQTEAERLKAKQLDIINEVNKPAEVAAPVVEIQQAPKKAEVIQLNPDVEKTIKEISRKDITFSVVNFLNGAKIAFEMVVEGFAKKDRSTLQSLLSNAQFVNFSKAIDEMEAKGHSQATDIVSISKEQITEATLDGNTARLKVSFISEQISVTRDADGNIIEGDPALITEVEDEWVFERDVTSNLPNWEIVAV